MRRFYEIKLVVGKMLRSTEIKFEVTESKLSLLLKHNIIHVEKHSCEQLLCTYNHSAIQIIKVKRIIFKHIQLVLFVYLI